MTRRARQKVKRSGGRSARVRDAVLRSALALISEKSADGVTIADLAKRSGVHETSIYRRWATPNAVILAACLRFAGDAVPTPDTGALRSDLIAMMRRAVALHKGPLATLRRKITKSGEARRRKNEKIRRR